jgi:hypothetical protein
MGSIFHLKTRKIYRYKSALCRSCGTLRSFDFVFKVQKIAACRRSYRPSLNTRSSMSTKKSTLRRDVTIGGLILSHVEEVAGRLHEDPQLAQTITQQRGFFGGRPPGFPGYGSAQRPDKNPNRAPRPPVDVYPINASSRALK